MMIVEYWRALVKSVVDAASLDRVNVLNQERMGRLLREFLDCDHNDRTHLSLGKDPPHHTSPPAK
jgi:hypothetical protein